MLYYNQLEEGKVYHINGKGNCVLSDKPNLCFTPVEGGDSFLHPILNIDVEAEPLDLGG